MSLLAFRVANLWIKEQTTKHERDRMQPTVLQCVLAYLLFQLS
jgi:hypothetical protein